MSDQRTHHVTTSDGVTIGAIVRGQGPPLVFLHGILGDGDTDWSQTVQHLHGRFSCHLPSLRGRGLSGEHPDLTPGRIIEDYVAYIDSIEGPTGLVGWSMGADLALAVAGTQPDAVSALAPVEPVLPPLMNEQEQAALGSAAARMGGLAADGNLVAAARAFADFPFTSADIAAIDATSYFETTGRYVPNILSLLQQQMEHEGPTADDPAVLAGIAAPVLVLHGSDSKPYGDRATRHVVDHVSTATASEISGASHAIPLTHSEALAEALTEFFTPVFQPA